MEINHSYKSFVGENLLKSQVEVSNGLGRIDGFYFEDHNGGVQKLL